jgi:hypothetical protein
MSSTKITEAVFQPLSKLQVLGGQHDDWTNSAYLPNRFVYDIELRTTQCHERCLQRMQKKKKLRQVDLCPYAYISMRSENLNSF